MVVPKKYQFSDRVKRKFLALLGTFAMAITSLKDTIWIPVMMAIRYRWPENIAVKKPPIMTKVHIDRVMKFAFFLSYSDCSGGSSSYIETVSAVVS